jgi:hypothetical protein
MYVYVAYERGGISHLEVMRCCKGTDQPIALTPSLSHLHVADLRFDTTHFTSGATIDTTNYTRDMRMPN